MSIETYQFNLPITPGSIPPVLHLSQYDSGRTFTAVLRDDANVPFELDSGATAVIKGRNAAGIAWQQDCTVSGANVTFTPSGAATDQFGVMPVTIEITESEEVISPLCVVFHIQKAGYTNEEAVLSPDFETAIQAAVAQAISEGGLGFSDEFKEALLACFNGVAWTTTGGQALIDDLEAALYPDVHLASITAAYDQDRPIYDTDSLDLVRLDLVVTANYSDGTSEVVTDYTLSGTLMVGSSMITVSYGGKTTTISVTVSERYTRYDYLRSTSSNADSYVNTGLTHSPGWSTLSVEFEAMNKHDSSGSVFLFGANGGSPGSTPADVIWYARANKAGYSAYNLAQAKQLANAPGDTRAVCKYVFVDGGQSYLQWSTDTVNVATVSKSSITANNKPLILCGSYALDGSGNYKGILGNDKARLGYVKFTDPTTGNIVYHFKPAYDNKESKWGFLNEVSGVFYPQTGGNLVGGNWT